CVEQDDKGWDARKRAYCLKIQPATGSFARNLIYSTKPIAEQKKEPEMTVRYYISSADLTAEKFATAIRNHWHVENKLHWRLDVVMNEDDCKIRRGNAAELFSGIRHIAI
ncbi:ISAs1 family transposase, partial [Escherichia coli]